MSKIYLCNCKPDQQARFSAEVPEITFKNSFRIVTVDEEGCCTDCGFYAKEKDRPYTVPKIKRNTMRFKQLDWSTREEG